MFVLNSETASCSSKKSFRSHKFFGFPAFLCISNWTLSNHDCMILRSIFSHRGQLRDSYATITEATNGHWRSSKKKHAFGAGRVQFFNLRIRVNLTYFVFWKTTNFCSLWRAVLNKKTWYLGKIRKMYTSPFCSKVFIPWLLKGSYDAISSFAFSLECYKLFVHR